MDALAFLKNISLPWMKPPPPPPPEPAFLDVALPIAIAVCGSWLLPAVVFMLSTRNANGRVQSTVPAKPSTTDPSGEATKKVSHPGVLLGSVSVFVMVASSAIAFPFAQTRRDALGCDALCQGGQTSLRSALSLVGASLIGRASDTLGRVPMLWVGVGATLSSLAINLTMDTIEGMWLALVPIALFNQNFSVAKALFSDYIDEVGGSDTDRAGAVGKLGMAVGFAFMFGPVIATLLVTDYTMALYFSAGGTAIAALVLLLLPSPKPSAPKPQTNGQPSSNGLMDFLRMPVLQTPGAQLLMSVRLLMAFAFHMFIPIWQVSIKRRFNFAPKDHAQFMGLIGLTYALSQGLLAKPMIRRAGSDPTRLLLLCITVLGANRPFALFTSSVGVVYVLYVPAVLSLGVMNTAITTACSGLAAGDQLGGLFGVLESVESIAGMVGPAAGGLLSRTFHDEGTVTAVCCCYAFAFVLVSLFFNKHVVMPAANKVKTA